MPEGLLDALNDEQVTDLMTYLMTLKQTQNAGTAMAIPALAGFRC